MRNRTGDLRRLTASEEERLMGMPDNITLPLLHHPRYAHADRCDLERARKSLLGNAWQQDVARFWLHTLVAPFMVRPPETSQVTHWPSPLRNE